MGNQRWETMSTEQISNNHHTETEWVVVAHAPGMAAAAILVGRLQAVDIPARAWQEGASQAFPVTVGLLGTAHILVPAEYAEQAQGVLSDELEVPEDEDLYEDEEEEFTD